MIAKCWLLKKAPKAGLIATQIQPAAAHLQDRVNKKNFHCFMADQTDEDEVFDFSNVEFTRDDLVIALNDMVKEYRKLSHSFEEAKAENMSLKSSSAESSSDELEDADILKTELSKLQAENDMLRNEISELKAEVAKSTVELSSWNKANLTVQKICGNQKQASDKTGIGFNDSEFCEGEPMYEDALVDFFENAFVRSGVVISTVGGQLVEISEKLFAETFELPVDGLGDLSEMPKDAIFDAKSIVSLSGEPINLSGRKNQMKMPFRLLCDIVAKAISVKAGSFNAITVEKFSLMTAVVCGVKMNWAKFLFGVLKKMVSARSKQAKGFAIQISVLLATFPSVELGESSEFPASKILSKKTVLRFVSINDRDGAEEVTGAEKKKAVSKKRPAADIEAAVPKKKRTSKKKSISSISSLEMVAVAEEAVPIQQVAEPLDVEEPRCSSTDAVDLIIQQVLDETRAADAPADITQPAVSEEKHWFDLPYDDIVKQWEAERPVVTASDTEDEDIATANVAPADEVQQVQDFEAPISAEDVLSADEQMSLDDILLSIPVDIPLPSTCMEVTKITMGQMIKIPGVTEKTWFLNSLPRIPADDKGKEILVEKDPVKGNPAQEHYSLICADIDLLVSLRAKVIDEVTTFFNSFSLKKLASLNIEEMYRKEEQVLSWGETESPQEAIQRKFYILLKYRTILVWKFLEAWRELAKEARNLGLTWTKPCCSTIFEGSPRDRGAVIARSNSNTRSLCWIRRMLLVDGLWAVEFCADIWVKIPKRMISTEIPRQRQYDDTLPTMSIFFKLLRKRWADVCVEVVEFCASPRLLPIGSTQFCKSLQLAEPVFSFAPSRPTVFALRFSQFCSVFIDLSLFSWLPSTDISEFLSSIALDRTILRSVQRSQDSFAVAPSVQLSLEQHQSSSSTSDSSSSLHFDQTNVDATASSRPTISPDLSAVFADFQAALSDQIFVSQSDISSRMHKLEQSVCDSLRDQADIFKNLSQGARQEVRTLDDVHTIRFNEFRKTVLTQNATIFQGLADVRQVVDAVNAKVDIMAKRDAEATKEALSHQLLEFQSSAQENHNVIHAQLSELVDYIHRGSADKKGESGSRGLQKPADTKKQGSAVTPSFEQRVQMAQRRIFQTVLDADANRESQEAAERDRERRRKEARSLKRRRKD
ncbi:dystroglycan-like [Dorcoceras hygrometricum]|uniref:Dystroglycan-like n=1 Tax=Dorcoceras hygrometricum TaxID=472368 RepID=A0A2Z7BDX8_9LAMI|nr:dystroglycan-like [Dorcoceras hygrometricum]